MSLEQITTELLVFFLIYGGAAMAAFIACIYWNKQNRRHNSWQATAATAATAPSASLSSSAWDNL